MVTSDDMSWCRQNIDCSFGDVVFTGNGLQGSPTKDFALLTQCNHTVLTMGTFGIWAAYLTGGDTLYLANFTLPDSPFDMLFKPQVASLPKWVGTTAERGQAGDNSPYPRALPHPRAPPTSAVPAGCSTTPKFASRLLCILAG